MSGTDFVERFWAAPPVSRTIVASMFVVSALSHSGLLSAGYILFFPPSMWLFRLPPQLWRFITPFLLTGGGFSFVMDLYFTWIYGTGLEQNDSRFPQPGDFFVYICFIFTFIIITAGVILGSYVFTGSFLLALIYTFALANRGTKAHFILFQIPVELLPWAMLSLTLIMSGPYGALSQATGILAAHTYEFLTRLYPIYQGGRNHIQTPEFVKRYFAAGHAASQRVQNRAYGTGFRPAAPAQAASQNRTQNTGGGWTSGFSTGSWGSRGAGRRLGGD